jgi:hypothetical protein
MNKKTPTTSYFILLISLFLLAFLERTAFDLGPNIELVTTALILSAYYLGRRYSLWLVLSIMVATDLVIGNTNIFLFTWSGFLIPALFVGGLYNRFLAPHTKHNSPYTKKIINTLSLTSLGLSANIFFFLWTNFGVWLMGSMYTKNLPGLFMSYVNAIPFFRNQLTSALLFIPTVYIAIELMLHLKKKFAPQNIVNAAFAFKKQASR